MIWHSFSPHEMNRLVAWAAHECMLQQVGPKKVGYLIEAYVYLNEQDYYHIPIEVVLKLGNLVEPGVNSPLRWRQVNITVGNSVPPDWHEVPRLMDQLFDPDVQDTLTPTEFFKEFEEIHPFEDGNGRVGALIYNFLNDTYHPGGIEFPPNVFGDPRRTANPALPST